MGFNVVAKGPSDLQYYYGYAFNNAAEDEQARRWYKIERNYIADNMRRRLKKIKDAKVVHHQIVVSLIRDYYEKEKLVYNKLGLPQFELECDSEGMMDEKQIKAFIDKMEDLKVKLTYAVTGYTGIYKNGKFTGDFSENLDSSQASFMAVLNNSNFSNMITGKTTLLSFTEVGKLSEKAKDTTVEKQRAYGKEYITKPVTRLLKAVDSGDLKEIKLALNGVIKLMREDFDVDSKEWKAVRKQLNDLFIRTIDKDLHEWAKSFYNEDGKLKRTKRGNWTNLGNVEQEVKKIIKEMYRKIIKDSEVNKSLVAGNVFMGGALEVYDKFYDNKYGSEFLYQVMYEGYRGKRTEKMESGGVPYVAEEFLKFLWKNMRIFITQDRNGHDYIKALDYLTDENLKKVHTQLCSAFKGEDPSVFAAFAKSNVNGLLGEVGACVAFMSSGPIGVKYTGRDLNKKGRQIGSDMMLSVDGTLLGVQIKNYTTQKNPRLYPQEYRLGLDFSQYISSDDLQLIRFLVANLPLVERVSGDSNFPQYRIEDIERFLMVNYTSTFARSKDLQSNDKVDVSFYYVNNVVTPFSLILAKQVLELLENSSKYNFEFDTSTLPPLFEPAPRTEYDTTPNFFPVGLQTKKERFYDELMESGDYEEGEMPISRNLLAINDEIMGTYYPIRLSVNNIVANTKFRFKGIALK